MLAKWLSILSLFIILSGDHGIVAKPSPGLKPKKRLCTLPRGGGFDFHGRSPVGLEEVLAVELSLSSEPDFDPKNKAGDKGVRLSGSVVSRTLSETKDHDTTSIQDEKGIFVAISVQRYRIRNFKATPSDLCMWNCSFETETIDGNRFVFVGVFYRPDIERRRNWVFGSGRFSKLQDNKVVASANVKLSRSELS
mgnify:CR=1 FL=1